jgi:hypothetical protein
MDLKADLFDVRLLASRAMPWGSRPGFQWVPLCPMLTQSWHLLRARGVDLPPILQQASAYLCASLWTTFEPAAAKLVIEAIGEGVLA